MSAADQHPQTVDEEYTLPSVEALFAGTLALMTGYAQSAPDCPNRPCMARKLVSNLLHLSAHPQLSPPMQTMLANLRTRWQLALEHTAEAMAVDAAPTPLWHPAPARVQ
jgi:hypothetical protein